jgi:hypothetical protein
VATSSGEAEYMAASDVLREVMWITQLLEELDYKCERPSIIFIDNQAAKAMAENDVMKDKSKHIDIKYHFIREAVKEKRVEMKWVSTKQQLADILTKGVKEADFTRIRDVIMKTMKNTL